ncbi:MAG: putative capsule biosynthesis protein [Deltaproteobacteria bacterium]|nr:putative capsule biosynthesis protein [Deltaproteobacteria bacterium]
MIKISFVGDILCQRWLLKAAKKKDGSFDFTHVFQNMKDIFAASDYVVGNLETVCAGKKNRYTNDLYSYNSPDSFLDALAGSGIDMVTCANNHCLDRGCDGLYRTLSLLDTAGIQRTGAYLPTEDCNDPLIIELHGKKIAFISATSSTNRPVLQCGLGPDGRPAVKLLQYQHPVRSEKGMARKCYDWAKARVPLELRVFINDVLGRGARRITVDNGGMDDFSGKLREDMMGEIKRARDGADYVIVCPHMGGQFNSEPGAFSKYMMTFFQTQGAECVVANHAHVVQRSEWKEEMLACYCLGNFSVYPSTSDMIAEQLSEYSIMLHLYLDDRGSGLITSGVGFSVLKSVADDEGLLTVYPVTDLYNKLAVENERQKLRDENSIIVKRFCETMSGDIDVIPEYRMEIPQR